MTKPGFGRKLSLTLGSFLISGMILVIYFKAPLLPVLFGGLIAFALIFIRDLK